MRLDRPSGDQAVIVTIYLASAAYAICSAMNLLPAGW